MTLATIEALTVAIDAAEEVVRRAVLLVKHDEVVYLPGSVKHKCKSVECHYPKRNRKSSAEWRPPVETLQIESLKVKTTSPGQGSAGCNP